MVPSIFHTLFFVFTCASAQASEFLDQNTFQTESLSVELGSSNILESKMDVPFTIQEKVIVEATVGVQVPGLNVTASVFQRGFHSEHNVDPILFLQVVAQAEYSAIAMSDVPVSVRVIGAESGIVHYLQSVKVSVMPRLTIRVSLLEDGSVGWSAPKEVRLQPQDQPLEVVFVYVKNEIGEPVRIHSQGGPIPHQPGGQFLQDVGDTYGVVIDTAEPSKNIYWEHIRQNSSDQRVIWFNSED